MGKHIGIVSGRLGLALTFGLTTTGWSATDAGSDFRIMSDAEIEAQRATIASLQGEAREQYRAEQYEQLRERARQHGFLLPATPPWTTAPADIQPVADPALRHAEMRERLATHSARVADDSDMELRRLQEAASAQQREVEAMMQQAPSPPPPQVVPAPPEPEPVPMSPPTAESSGDSPAQAADTASNVVPTSELPQPPASAVRPDTAAAAAATTAATMNPGSNRDADVVGPGGTMDAYRKQMRDRFDAYMKERQAQQDETIRRQRQQHEAKLEKGRAWSPGATRFAPPPFPATPAMPSYGPRYPSAFPGYRTPYWQQPR